MRPVWKWLLLAAAAVVLLAAGALAALWRWTASDDFRVRAEREATQALGVPVRLGAIALAPWPPAVALHQVTVQSQPPLTLERVEARPAWAALLSGSPAIDALVVRQAVLPQQAIGAIALALQKKNAAAAPAKPVPAGAPPALPRELRLEAVTWVDERGRRMTLDAQARLGPDGLPASAEARITAGRFAGAHATLQRQPDQAWALHAAIGGGTVSGPLALAARPNGGWSLQGRLVTDKVEVSALTAPSRTLTGRLDAQTQLSAEFREVGALADALRTQTRFSVRNAVVHGLDLAQAVKSVGTSRGGQTALDTLAGNVTTQGRAVQLSNLVATSGLLAAKGQVALSPARALSGQVTVAVGGDALGGALGVPLVVGGTLDDPSVTLSRAALVGAAVGTAVLPGAGTAAGASLGDTLGRGLRGLLGGK